MVLFLGCLWAETRQLRSRNGSPPMNGTPFRNRGAYEMYFLIALKNADYLKYKIQICRPSDLNTGNGQLTVDWGDGTVESWDSGWSYPEHTYSSIGMYLIKITSTAESCFLQNIGYYNYGISTTKQLLLMAKLGAEILLTNERTSATQNGFNNQTALKYVSLGGKEGLPAYCFAGCWALQAVKITNPMTEVKTAVFSNCYSLKSVDLSQTAVIGDYAFSYCRKLDKINAPICTSVGNSAFSSSGIRSAKLPKCTTVGNYGFTSCYGLDAPSSIEVAEGCTFGSNCFNDTYIYPEII